MILNERTFLIVALSLSLVVSAYVAVPLAHPLRIPDRLQPGSVEHQHEQTNSVLPFSSPLSLSARYLADPQPSTSPLHSFQLSSRHFIGYPYVLRQPYGDQDAARDFLPDAPHVKALAEDDDDDETQDASPSPPKKKGGGKGGGHGRKDSSNPTPTVTQPAQKSPAPSVIPTPSHSGSAAEQASTQESDAPSPLPSTLPSPSTAEPSSSSANSPLASPSQVIPNPDAGGSVQEHGQGEDENQPPSTFGDTKGDGSDPKSDSPSKSSSASLGSNHILIAAGSVLFVIAAVYVSYRSGVCCGRRQADVEQPYQSVHQDDSIQPQQVGGSAEDASGWNDGWDDDDDWAPEPQRKD